MNPKRTVNHGVHGEHAAQQILLGDRAKTMSCVVLWDIARVSSSSRNDNFSVCSVLSVVRNGGLN